MNQTVVEERQVRVMTTDGAQTVRIPDEFRFSGNEIFVGREATTGVILLSERPLMKPKLDEAGWKALWDKIDAIGDEDFEIERDRSLPRDVEL